MTLIHENAANISSLETNGEIQKQQKIQQTIIAPVDGIVKSINFHTLGGVIGQGQEVAELLPNNDLWMEIEIMNQDIGKVEIGQKVEVKLDAYNFQEYGKIEGTLTDISPDTIWSESKGWIYQGKISLSKEQIQGVEIQAGLEGTAEIKVDERRIIEFFLELIVEHFDGSLEIE